MLLKSKLLFLSVIKNALHVWGDMLGVKNAQGVHNDLSTMRNPVAFHENLSMWSLL